VAGLDAHESARVARGLGPGWVKPESAGRPFTVLSEVGRLLEIRLFGVCGLDDIAALTAQLREAAHSLDGRPIIFGDFRRAPPFSQAVADQWSRDMRGFNDRLTRSALLLSTENGTFNLQFERVVRCAGCASRRLFSSAGELREWLRGSLTQVELARLDRLLDAPGPARGV